MAARTLPSPPVAAAETGAASVRSRTASVTPGARDRAERLAEESLPRRHQAVAAEADLWAASFLDLEPVRRRRRRQTR